MNVASIADHNRYEWSEEAPQERRSIQVEDGYTRIANPILDALCCADFSPREFRVVHFVIRETYGWQVKQKRMSGEFIASRVKLDPSRCSKVLNELIRRDVIIRHGGSRSPVSLNKNVDDWKPRVGSKRQPPSKCAESAHCEPSESAHCEPAYKERKETTPSLRSGVSGKPSKKSPAKSALEYTEDFEQAWSQYPKRAGSNPKRDAFKAWRARLTEGVSPEEMIAGVQRYAAHIQIKGSSATEFVMQGKRFFGPAAEFENDWTTPAPSANGYGAQGGQYANRSGTDAKRAEQDRIAARLADPNDDGWMDGLFEEDAASGAGEPSVYAPGSDIPQDVAHGVQHGSDAYPGQAGSGYIDGEVVNAADDAVSGHGGRADQGRGRGVAAERRQPGEVFETEAGGLWNA
tara:strand:- start:17591 stop:18802 length:1212 start_codon:yes stop_codon:yes gene_type:complete